MPNQGESVPASQHAIGTKAIAVTNTAVALSSSSVQCRAVIVCAHPSNGAQVWIGNSAVVSTPAGSETGIALQANEKFSLDIDDVSKVFVNGTSGDKVTFIALQN
jgi:hypothetical protein